MQDEIQVEAPPPTPARRLRARRVDAQAARDRRQRLVTWGLSVTLGVLLISALVGETGYLAMLRTRRDVARATADLARQRLENQRLQLESRRLEQDEAAVEEEARRQLGFIKPGETLVIVRPPAPTAPPSPGPLLPPSPSPSR